MLDVLGSQCTLGKLVNPLGVLLLVPGCCWNEEVSIIQELHGLTVFASLEAG